jgi:hypothetical protein
MSGSLPIAYDADEPADGDTTNLSTFALADGSADDDAVKTAVMPAQLLSVALLEGGESTPDVASSDNRATSIDLAPPVHHDEPKEPKRPWWRRLGAWLVGCRWFRQSPRTLPPLPPQSRGGTLVSQASELSGPLLDEMFHWLWRLDEQRLESIEALSAHVRAARAGGPRAFLEEHVRFVLSREHPGRDGTIRISRLRDKLVGYARGDVDQALSQLAAEGVIELVAAEPVSGEPPRDQALHVPIGGVFKCVRMGRV